MNVIQIGANRGYDDLTELIKEKIINKLILVEPFEEHNKSLEACYSSVPNLVIENIIIHDEINKNESLIFYHANDATVPPEGMGKFELASLNKFHSLGIRQEYRKEGILKRRLKSITINQLFEKYQLLEIDILFIDTEGYDCKIIKSINFEKYKIKNLFYENLHCDVGELQAYLESKDYLVTRKVLTNQWMDNAKLR